MSDDTSVTTPKLRDTRYYEKVSYPTLLLQLLSRATGLLSRPPKHSGEDALAVLSAANTVETIYYSLPTELRTAVNAKLKADYRKLYRAVANCISNIENGVLRLKNKSTSPSIPRLALLREHRTSTADVGLPLFLWRRVQYFIDENGNVVGAVILDPSPCIEGCDIDTLIKAFVMITRGEVLTPQQQMLLRVCNAGLRTRVYVALRVLIDILNQSGLLLSQGEVWVGEA